MTTKTLANILIRVGIVPAVAWDSPELYDNYATVGRIVEAATLIAVSEPPPPQQAQIDALVQANGILATEIHRLRYLLNPCVPMPTMPATSPDAPERVGTSPEGQNASTGQPEA